MIDTDYYGNELKWFIGVVKDTNDVNNRVRVRIFGIHPDDDFEIEETPPGNSTTPQDSTSPQILVPKDNQTATGQSTSYNFQNITTLAKVQPDYTNYPTPSAQSLDSKISPSFSLGQLSVKTTSVSGSTIQGYNQGYLSKDAITNLQVLSFNTLEPIKTQFPNLKVHSGWRWMSSEADRSASGGNHPKGYAADISVSGMSCLELAQWCLVNLKGRFNLLLLEHMGSSSWVHIQLGGNSGQGTTSNPLWGTYFVGGGTTTKTYNKFIERG